jgi:hypothetical protein
VSRWGRANLVSGPGHCEHDWQVAKVEFIETCEEVSPGIYAHGRSEGAVRVLAICMDCESFHSFEASNIDTV